MAAIPVTPAEALQLARIREAELGAAAQRAHATHLQAIADRFRLEGNEAQAAAFETTSDAALAMARRHFARYQTLVLGRNVDEADVDPVALDAIARDANSGLAPRDSVSYGR